MKSIDKLNNTSITSVCSSIKSIYSERHSIKTMLLLICISINTINSINLCMPFMILVALDTFIFAGIFPLIDTVCNPEFIIANDTTTSYKVQMSVSWEFNVCFDLIQWKRQLLPYGMCYCVVPARPAILLTL